MSVDDQLFKEDGTLLTKIDIFVLKSARLIATYVFSDPEDETYEKALVRMRRVGSILIIASAILFGLIGYLPDLVMLGFMGTIKYIQSYNSKCSGKGTRVSRFQKVWALLFLLLPNVSMPTVIRIVILDGWSAISVSYFLLAAGYFIVILGDYYVSRLGQRPPRKKKERVPVPVLSPQ